MGRAKGTRNREGKGEEAGGIEERRKEREGEIGL